MKTKKFTLLAITMLAILTATVNVNAQVNKEPAKPAKVSVRQYPNPAFDNTTIESTLPAQLNSDGAVITISNVAGQTMFTKQCSDCGGKVNHIVNVKFWPSGLYFVSLRYKDAVANSKFFVFN